MTVRRLAHLVGTRALTVLVMTGALATIGRPVAAAETDVQGGPPSLEASTGVFDEKPLEAEVVAANTLLTVTKLPEKLRLRFGVKNGCTDAPANAEACRPPAPRAPLPRPPHGAPPARRLAESAGRAAAPSTAPPPPTT